MSDPLEELKKNQIQRLKLDFELGLIRTQQKDANTVTEREMLQKQVDTIMQGYSQIFHKNMELFGDIIDNIKGGSNDHRHRKQEPFLESIQGQTLLKECPSSP
jgi:hypothetical protein